jgi:tryptophan synthase, alpha subunit
MTQNGVFNLVKEVRRDYTTPVVLLAYANHLIARGISRFYEDAAAAGVDGVLVVDMPPEECEEARLNAEKNAIDQIFIIAPTTRDHRRDMILQKSAGFLYLVSVLGVTGVRHRLSPETLAFVRDLRSHTPVPLAVGFGISSPDHVMPLAGAGADAVIVGSGIVDIIGRSIAGQPSAHDELAAFARDMREACNNCSKMNRS